MKFADLVTVLTIVFVCLKLSGVVSWSWWLVFLPLIVWLIVAAIVVISVVVFVALQRRRMGK